MIRHLGWVSVGLLGAYAVAGCGGDSENSNTGTGGAPGGGMAGNTPTSTGGTQAGSGGTVTGMGGSGIGGAAAPAPVACGTKMCAPAPPLIPGFPSPAPCCADMAAGTCGTSSPLMGGACAPPPAPDPDCDSISMMGIMAAGCCASNGNCGIDASLFGAGCQDISNPMFARFLMGITPKRCDGTPIPQGSGGMPGTGGGGGAAGAAGGAGGSAGAAGAAGASGAAGSSGAGGGGGGQGGAGGAAGSSGAGGGGGKGGSN